MMNIFFAYGFRANYEVVGDLILAAALLASGVSDGGRWEAAWSQFFEHLSCKAEEAGRMFIKVNPAYTTQDCSRCHHRQSMPLNERTYHCSCCFLVIDRDLNASYNILGLGLQSRVIPEAPGL